MATATQSPTNPPTDRPLYWLVILDQAVELGQFELAVQAQRELRRLGVRVEYCRPRPHKEVASVR